MVTAEGGRQEWRLSEEAFARLLALFHPDRDQAAQRYEVVRRKLGQLFRWRGLHEVEALVDATFDRVARRLDEGAELWAKDPYSYLHGVALRVAQEQHRKDDREQRALREMARSGEPTGSDGSIDADDRRPECLTRCLGDLDPASRRLVERYHEGSGGPRIRARQALAAELGIAVNALRIRAYRIRAGLLACIAACAGRPKEPAK